MFEIFAEREDRVAFLAREGTRSRVLSTREFFFGGLQFLQSVFPLRFEPARDEALVRIDRAIAAVRRVARHSELARHHA